MNVHELLLKAHDFLFPKPTVAVAEIYRMPLSQKRARSCRARTFVEATAEDIVYSALLNRLRKKNSAKYVHAVARAICFSTLDPFLRIKTAHDVTGLLLEYDWENFWANTIPPQSLDHIFRTGKAVCRGYANVFKAFCDEMKIPCETVSGYGWGGCKRKGESNDITEASHAWNIVCAAGEWYPVDCTWDKPNETEWLFPEAEYFALSHFPHNSAQQLLKIPYTFNEFLILPHLFPNITQYVSHFSRMSHSEEQRGQFEIEYRCVNRNRWIDFWVYDENDKRILDFEPSISRGNAGTKRARFAITERGKYTVKIMGHVYYKIYNCGGFTLDVRYPARSV